MAGAVASELYDVLCMLVRESSADSPERGDHGRSTSMASLMQEVQSLTMSRVWSSMARSLWLEACVAEEESWKSGGGPLKERMSLEPWEKGFASYTSGGNGRGTQECPSSKGKGKGKSALSGFVGQGGQKGSGKGGPCHRYCQYYHAKGQEKLGTSHDRLQQALSLSDGGRGRRGYHWPR
jgi:hypothetical protein